MEKLLEIKNLKKHFIIKGEKAGQNRLRAVAPEALPVEAPQTGA